MTQPNFDVRSIRVPILIVLSLLSGAGWIVGALVWGSVTTRIENLETGRTTPMAATTKIEIDYLKERVRKLETQCPRQPQ